MSIVEAYFGARRQMQAEEQARQELALRQAAEQRAAEMHAMQIEQQRAAMADSERVRTAVKGLQDASGRMIPEDLVSAEPRMVPDTRGVEMAAQGLAAARGDAPTLLALRDREQAGALKQKRAAEFERLSRLSDEELASEYKDINDDPRVPAKVRYDPKARAFVVQRDDGQVGMTNRADAIEGRMAMWDARNGDVTGGMDRMRALRKDRRATARDDFRDSLDLAKANEGAQDRGEQRAIQRGHLGVAQADAGRRAAEFRDAAPVRQARASEASLALELGQQDETTPEGRARIAQIQTKLQALQTGTRGAAGGQDPAVVKAAQALVAANPGMDQSTALDIVISKPDQLHKSFVEIGLKEMLPPDKAVERADVVMQQMGWKRAGSRWSRSAAATGAAPAASGSAAAVPPASERKVGQTYQTPRGPMIWRGSGWEPA